MIKWVKSKFAKLFKNGEVEGTQSGNLNVNIETLSDKSLEVLDAKYSENVIKAQAQGAIVKREWITPDIAVLTSASEEVKNNPSCKCKNCGCDAKKGLVEIPPIKKDQTESVTKPKPKKKKNSSGGRTSGPK